MFSRKMFASKKTAITFVILVITFLGMFGISVLANQASDQSKQPYLSKIKSLMQENRANGISSDKSIEKIMQENTAMVSEMTEKMRNESKIIVISSIFAAIILLYLASVAITYFTREKRT